MFNSNRGNSFRITKKVLCVFMAVSLSLMMLPAALFRTQAEAAPAATDDVFVKADSDMTNFGQFAYNPNSNAANISTYTQNDLLYAIGCKAETEESLHEQVANEVKAFLIENQFSPVDDVFPAAKEGYQLTGTSIASVTSQLACLTATYDKTTGKAKFVTSAPANSAQNGVVIITAEYAKLIADYDIVFSSLTTDLNAAKELQINTKTCEGKITITPTANKDTNGKTIYKLTVDTAIKNINKLANNYNVSVNVDTTKSGEPAVIVNNGEVKVDLSSIIPDQDMREVADMKTQLTSVIGGDAGKIDIGSGNYRYLGVLLTDKILANNAYSVKNQSISNVTIITQSDAQPVFGLFNDEARQNADPENTLTIDNAKFNIKAPETASGLTDLVGFYDEDDFEHEFIPSSDFFPGDYASVKGKNNVKVCKSTDSIIEFKESCKACDRPSSGTQATANILIKTTTNNSVIKYASQQCNFVSDSGYLGYSVEDKDDEGEQEGKTFIDDVWSFFFGQGKLKVKFRYVRSAASDYTHIKVANKNRTNLIMQDTSVEETDNEKIFIAIFGDEDVGKLASLEGKYIHAYDSFGSRRVRDLLTNEAYPKTIIANAPAPKSITVETSGITKDNDVVTNDVTLSIKVTMEQGEGDYFKYTVAAKKTDTIATIVDVSNPSQTSAESTLTYADFGDPLSHSGDVWTASKTFQVPDLDPESPDTQEEHDYTINVLKIVDILQRGDNAQEETPYHFSIDKRNPSLGVTWNPAEGSTPGYFNQKRQATITIDEMNYKEPVIEQSFNGGSYQTVAVSWNPPAGYVHTGTFICEAEGHYDIRIKGEDLAGHKLNGVEGDYQHTEDFTLDFHPPEISINFDNNAVVNHMYYTGPRKATIRVSDNYGVDPEKLVTNPIAYVGTAPVPSAWEEQADGSYICTVEFNWEGSFALVVKAEDLAGNSIEQSNGQFVIDWTKPTINISGVENRQAYGGNAQPVVTINDANMSPATTCQVESLGITKGHPYNTSPAASDTQYTYAYANPEAIPENDGVYRVNVNAVDMAGNGDVQERVWSVNRFGSTYVIDAETETMMDGYVNNDNLKDVKVTEINPSGVETHSVDMTKDSFTETLTEGQDYTAAASGGDGTWYECLFTISKDFFKEDGKYTFNYYSKDRAGNESENTMENKNADHNAAVNVQFMLDNAKPTVSFDNLSSGLYGEAKHEATANFEDNSGKFSEAKVIINGEEHYASGDELDENRNAIEFELNDAPVPYTIETFAIDKAGNEMDKEVKTVVVTMNPFLLWFYNTPLFVGSMVVLVAAIGGVLFYLYRRGLWIFAK